MEADTVKEPRALVRPQAGPTILTVNLQPMPPQLISEPLQSTLSQPIQPQYRPYPQLSHQFGLAPPKQEPSEEAASFLQGLRAQETDMTNQLISTIKLVEDASRFLEEGSVPDTKYDRYVHILESYNVARTKLDS